MVDNSISLLRTHFGLIFSSFECITGCVILRSSHLELFSPTLSLFLLYYWASSHVIPAHIEMQGVCGKGWHRTSFVAHRRFVLPAARAFVRCRYCCASILPPRSRGCASVTCNEAWGRDIRDNRLATLLREPAGSGSAEMWPTCGGLDLLPRDGHSDSLAR